MTQDDKHLSIQDVYNVIAEHMTKLDVLWPDSELHGPRKVHIVELIDAIKLKLAMVAEKNMTRYESPFEKAAKKITGTSVKPTVRPSDQFGSQQDQKSEQQMNKTAMQMAHEQAQARMRR